MAIQAKVVCNSSEAPTWDTEKKSRTVRFTPVYDPDPSSPNYTWSQATPGGYLELTINNPDAFNAFSVGTEYLLTFEEAD